MEKKTPNGILKGVTVNGQVAKRNIVNASYKVLFAQTYASVKDVRIVNRNMELLPWKVM